MTVDIFNIPLYYISFKENKNIEKHYRDHGFKNVNHFEAVDGRKFNPDELLKDGIISIRAYDDLKSGRNESSGIPTLGGVGCALSHYRLLRRCIRKNWPYIIVTEEDNKMKTLTPEIVKDISKHMEGQNSYFNSTSAKRVDHRLDFHGTNFYIASQGACKQFLKNFFPIDVQIDWFMLIKVTIGDVNFKGYKISDQKLHSSSIQDICVKCYLPKDPKFYFFIIFIIAALIAFSFYKVKTCKVKLTD